MIVILEQRSSSTGDEQTASIDMVTKTNENEQYMRKGLESTLNILTMGVVNGCGIEFLHKKMQLVLHVDSTVRSLNLSKRLY